MTAHVTRVEHTPTAANWHDLVEKVLAGITEKQFKKWC